MWRVLVVDDDRAIRELLRVVLELEGYEVATADNGCAALAELEQASEPWVVLMDVMMPRTGGVEVCRRLSAAGMAGPRHQVALMTAGLLEREECPEPARALLRKPFDLDDVVRLVASLAREREGAALALLGAGRAPCEAEMAAAS
jgi:two-component system response regulator MprA